MKCAAGVALLLAGCTTRATGVGTSDFAERGRLVCLLEEMNHRHGVELPPVHEHVPAFGTEARVYPLLRTAIAEGLFVDARFKGRDLRLSGRRFADSGALEVIRVQWWDEGKLEEVAYWCDVCAIKEFRPGSCSCCQGDVRLRQWPEE